MIRTVSLWIRIDGKYVHPSYANSKQTQLRPQDGQYHLRFAGKWHPVGSDPLLALDAKAAKEKLLRDVERGVVPVVVALPHLVKQPTRLTVAAAVTEYLVETNDYGDNACQKSRENKRVRKSAMPPEVPVVDAEPKADHIEVGDYGAQHASHPDTLGNFGSIEARSDAQGCDRVREGRGHSDFFRDYCSYAVALGKAAGYFRSGFLAPSAGVR